MSRSFQSPVWASLLVFCLLSCKGKDPAPTEKNMALLTNGTWAIHSVSVDNVDRTNLFAGLALKFDAKKITATHGGPVWPESQTWNFSDGTALKFTREDMIEVTIIELSPVALKLELTWNKTIFDGGRSRSVSGGHVFHFKK